MKHISILVPEGQCNMSSIIGPYKIFSKADQYRVAKKEKPLFNVQLVGNAKKVNLYDGLLSIQPHCHFKEVRKTNLIIIPAISTNNLENTVQKNKVYTEWIRKQHQQGAEIASICTGAFILASTGLIDHKQCSTHWNEAARFRTLFPSVNMVPDKLITDENGIYTNGGAYSFLHLLMYLVEKYYGRETAVYCSKIFEVDIDRGSQSRFTIFSGLKDHQDEPIKKAQTFIENNLHKKISIEELAKRFAIGRRHFDRRFVKATSNTPLEYLQKVKMEAAKKSLENSRKTVQEVMYDVGYSDAKAFREIFRRITGLSPLDYRNKYNRDRVSF